ncbi:MAG TPA: UDP-N-acetylmuramoyl-tripeptide--D-alanyl-D-alanine ligase [Chlamydiales bacterium]|nr:UDP-N-acetylmuramoyl-tripeptide--D-alanyl-D-alanine ligase [Chlamydiales bacterium]
MRNIPLSQIAQSLEIAWNKPLPVAGYQIDSRNIRQNELFFALKGEQTDGHRFLGEVSRRGALGAVVEKSYTGPNFGLYLFPVQNVQAALQELAREDLSASGAKVIGITGSVGKTTTKDFLAELLMAKYRVGCTPGNYNTKLTLPLSILNREGGEEIFVLEMGMSEPGDIAALLQIAQPEVALVTKVALAHAAHFPGGLEEIAKAKAEIFSSPKLKTAIYFQELSQYSSFRNAPGEKVVFSLKDRGADYFLSSQGSHFVLDERGVRAYQFDLPFQATHLLHNFLAAAGAARLLKLEWDQINARLPFLKPPKMRFEKIEKEGIVFINDAYNANPESMKAAFCSLPQPEKGGKRIAVLGTMSPLGSFSKNAHEEIGELALEYFDIALVFGEEAKPLFESFSIKKPAEFFMDLKKLKARLTNLMSPGDVVLVKGSRNMQMDALFL